MAILANNSLDLHPIGAFQDNGQIFIIDKQLGKGLKDLLSY